LLSALRESLLLERAAIREAGNSEIEHIPATPEEFIEAPEFLGNRINGEYWPVVKQDVLDFYASEKREACFCEAIGSGKSYKSSIIAAYGAHRLLCLKNPAKTLGLSSDSKLTILNMGTRAMQARKIVFSKIKGRVDSCPWFKLLYPYNHKITSELRFQKNIFIVPGNSRETFPLGYDLVLAILDEADFYVDNEDRPTADEIHQAMRMRLESRIGNRWPWKLITLSSPLYEDGFIERKMAEAQDPASEVFGRRRPIWEAKPWQYDGTRCKWLHAGTEYSIPEILLPEAKKNPIKFLRDRCAVSVTSLTPYFTDHDAILAAKDPALRFFEGDLLPADIVPHDNVQRFIHIDLALSRCAAGFAMGHREQRGSVIDFLWRIAPKDGKEVNFAAVRQAVLILRQRGFKIGKVTYDGWQSVDSIQLLTAKGIECEVLSVDRTLEPYDTFLEAINERRAFVPDAPILFKELRSLELVRGKKVDHPKNGSKDCSDACAGVFYHTRSAEIMEPQSVLVHKTSRSVAARNRPGYGGSKRYGTSRY